MNPRTSLVLEVLHAELGRLLGSRLDRLVLYGSRARGDARADSDIDVLVVVRGDCNYADLIRRTSPIVSSLSLKNDVVISRAFVSRDSYEQAQTPFLMNVRREGIPL